MIFEERKVEEGVFGCGEKYGEIGSRREFGG